MADVCPEAEPKTLGDDFPAAEPDDASFRFSFTGAVGPLL
jgi:hypothetical protein